MRIRLTFLMVLSVVAVSSPCWASAYAAAQPNVCRFWGTVSVGGASVAAGTEVALWVDEAGPWLTYTEIQGGRSVYVRDVPQDGPAPGKDGASPGDTVFFSVGSIQASQNGTWLAGEEVNVDLLYTAGINQIAFTTTSQSLVAGEVSDLMTIKTLDIFGSAATVASPTTLNLSSTSAQGRFSATGDPWADTTAVTISPGESSATFRYRDTLAGKPTITVSAPLNLKWTPAEQEESVDPSSHAAYTITPAASVQTAGAAFNVTTTAVDQFGNLLTDKDATLNGYSFVFSGPDGSPDGTMPLYPEAPSFSAGVWKAKVTLVCTEVAVLTVTDDQAAQLSGCSDAIAVGAAPVSTLALVTSSRAIAQGGISAPMTVQTRDQYGNLAEVSQNTTLTLNSTSAQGRFSAAGDPWVDIASVTIPEGGSSASFRYRDTLAGTPTITASAPVALGWAPAEQEEAISPSGHSGYTIVAAASAQTAGTALNVTITAVDQFGNVVTDKDAILNGYSFVFSGPSGSPDGGMPLYPEAPSFSAGVWANRVTLVCAESVVLTVTDDQATPMSASSDTITVGAAPVSRLAFTSYSQGLAAGEVSALMTVETRDAFGNAAVVATPTTLSLSSTSDQGRFSAAGNPWADMTSVTMSPGRSSASFCYRDTLAGTPTITASAPAGIEWVPTEQKETINASGHAGYTLAPAASVQTAGAAFNMTITAVDQFGNAVTGKDAALNGYSFVFSGPAGSPDGSAPLYPEAPSFSAGVWSARVTLVCAEVATLTVTDDHAAPLSASCAPITVHPARASILKVSGIADPLDAGTASDVTVTAADPYGNVDTSYGGTIHFTSSDDRAELALDYTFDSVDKGIHAFPDGVTLNTHGEQTVGATDTLNAVIGGEQTTTIILAGDGDRAAIIAGLAGGGVLVIGACVAYLTRRRRRPPGKRGITDGAA